MLNSKKSQMTRLIIMAIFSLVMIYPYWYMLVISLLPNQVALGYPPPFYPAHPTVTNFVQAWTQNHFGGDFFRSIYVTVVSMVLGTGSAAAAAFVISRYKFFGRKLFFYGFLASAMVPQITFIFPQFFEMKEFHLLNSLPGLFLIYAASDLPITLFLMKGFFDDVPQEIEDAVQIDGGGKWALFTRIMLPMSVPSLVTALLFNFEGGWDEFLKAITFISNPNKFTLPIALNMFQGQHSTQWGEFFAAALIQTVPVVVIFLIFQRQIVKGLLLGSVKG